MGENLILLSDGAAFMTLITGLAIAAASLFSYEADYSLFREFLAMPR